MAFYDHLIEEIAENGGFGNNFEENQPLNEEEMLELKSFTKESELLYLDNKKNLDNQKCIDSSGNFNSFFIEMEK